MIALAPKPGRARWPKGPWDSEPDRIEFESNGFRCLMVRQAAAGHWCGYVAVPPGHPWHGNGWDSVDASAHGGVTFAQVRPDGPEDAWWVGFDCAHSGDLSPGFLHLGFVDKRHATYRTADFVRAECERLAAQAAAAGEGNA